jgi:hypothetical protein
MKLLLFYVFPDLPRIVRNVRVRNAIPARGSGKPGTGSAGAGMSVNENAALLLVRTGSFVTAETWAVLR